MADSADKLSRTNSSDLNPDSRRDKPISIPKSVPVVHEELQNWQVLEERQNPHHIEQEENGIGRGLTNGIIEINHVEIEDRGTSLDESPYLIRSDEAPLHNSHHLMGSEEKPIEPDQTRESDDRESRSQHLIEDRQDTVIVVTDVDSRHQTVDCGETAEFQLTFLNNGERSATFCAYIEGWIEDEWVTISPTHTQLQPGERTSFCLAMTPPRRPSVVPGPKAVAIVIRSPEYPGRSSRTGLTLHIKPYQAFTLGELHPRQVETNWHSQSATLHVQLTNQGNSQTLLRLEGQSLSNGCRFEFFTPGTSSPRFEQTLLNLAPGQTMHVPVRIMPHIQKLLGLRPTKVPFRLVASVVHQTHVEQEFATRSAYGQLSHTPLIGPGILAIITGVTMLFLIAVSAILLLMLSTLLPATSPLVPTTQPNQASITHYARPAASPPVAFVLQMAESVPSTHGNAQAAKVLSGPPIISQASAQNNIETQPSIDNGMARGAPSHTESSREVNHLQSTSKAGVENAQNGIPIVRPEMVTAPGEPPPVSVETAENAIPTPVAVNAAPIAPTPTPATSSQMTYEEMFRLVALHYNLDWRLLAAQAYIESGFDPLALGSKGDLGLMQVLPSTWKEWSPRVGVIDPFDSYSNVLVAAAYLDYLRTLQKRTLYSQQGHDDSRWILTAYNWGPNQLDIFLENGGNWDTLVEIRRKYALDILRIADSLPEN